MPVHQQSIVAQWNEIALETIRAGGAKPTVTTYQLHVASSAIYDAWAAFDSEAYGHYSEIETALANTLANKAEAVSFAAYAALTDLFPDHAASFNDFMSDLGYDPANATTDPNTAAGVGTLAALNVLAARQDDGSGAATDFETVTTYSPVNSAEPGSDHAPGGADFDPNHWQPLRVPTGTVTDENGVPIIDNDDPDSFVDQEALSPHWGSVDSFALQSSDQFRPDAPPQLGDFSAYVDGAGNVTTNDQAYRDQIDEVIEYSANLTTEQKVIAEYWADGPRTESPPGHWNQIAQDIALREGHGIDQDAKMFFALNAALFDAGIATWEAKYTYDFVRPQSAIRDMYYDQTIEAWGGVDQGTQDILGQEWQPYQNVTFVTPPFPEYVSGHSTFSMSAAKTIASFVGSDVFYDGTTLGNYDLDSVAGVDLLGHYETDQLVFESFGDGPPVVLQWATLTEAAEEAGLSRLYGGIHIQDGNLNGLQVGREVAANAELRWSALFTRGGDDLIETGADGGLTIAGAGNDIVIGNSGDDVVEGGTGNDMLRGSAGDDLLAGQAGNDVLNGESVDSSYDPVAALVCRLYLTALDRAPDTVGLENWTERLLSHRMTSQQVAEAFVNSAEFQNAFGSTSNAEFVTLLYNTALNRDPDATGYANWTAKLDSLNLTRAEVVLGFSESAESLAKNAADALECSRAGAQADWSDDVFRLYQGVLDRNPDAIGFDTWTSALAEGGDYQSVVSVFFNSTEFQNIYGGTSNSEFVTLLFDNVLDRAPDPTGLANWTGQLDSGALTRAEIVGRIAQSIEFREKSSEVLETWMRDQGGDQLDGGSGNNLLFGGIGADTFVFDASEGGRHIIADMEAWDRVQITNSGFADAPGLIADLTQSGDDVYLEDNGTTILFANMELSAFDTDMFGLA